MARLTISSMFEAVDKLTGPVKTMSGSVQGFASKTKKSSLNIGQSIQGMGRLIKGAVVALSTGAAVKAINDFASKGDEIAKTARMLGLSAEALQELRFASDMQGVSAESLTVAFRQLNNNVGQLKTGQGALYSRLKLTNPQLARQLKDVESSEEAFSILIDAINAEEDASNKAALAQAAFGRSGQELLKFAAAGKDGIAKLRAEAHKYGTVISDEAATASEEFSDSVSRLKGSLQGLAYGVLGQIVAKLQPVIQHMADWVAANKELINQKIDQVFEALVPVFSAVGNVLAQVWPHLAKILDLVISLLPQLAPIVELLGGALSDVLATLMPILSTIIDLVAEILPPALKLIKQLLPPIIEILKPVLKLIESMMPFIEIFCDLLSTILVPYLKLLGAILEPILGFIGRIAEKLAEWLVPAIEKVSALVEPLVGKLNQLFGGGDKDINVNDNRGFTASNIPPSPMAGLMSTQTINNRSQLDVNLSGLPQGTTSKQMGTAPGINVNLGYSGGVR